MTMKTPEQMAEEYSKINTSFVGGALGSYRHGLFEGFLAGYQAAKDQLADVDKVMNSLNNSNGWISVKERLPEQNVAVLTYGQVLNNPSEVIGVRRRYNSDQEWKHTWESEDGFFLGEDHVTHWMPLPEAPEDK